MTDVSCDVCIVGAGPAGMTLALLLVRSGITVTVVERTRSLDREFRGEILQPGGQAILDELGVLDAARERGSYEHDRFVLSERGRTLINADYRTLPGPRNYLLSIPQRHLVAELLARCEKQPGFSYLDGTRVGELVEDSGRVTGVVCRGAGADQVVRARLVVGADGRYSKVRQLAGIDAGRTEMFDQDVLWFKLPVQGPPPRDVRVFRAGGNPVLAYGSAPGSVQIGWTLPHRGYQDMASKGFGHVKERLCAAASEYAEQIDAELTGFKDLSLLDVFAGCANEWVRDGLLLIGDSAHTFGPIGAQGINLAVQDAAMAHPVLVDALGRGDTSAAALRPFVAARRPAIDRMFRIQRIQSGAMLSTGKVASAVRPRMAAVVSRTPLYRLMLRQIAFGDPAIRVHSELFRAHARHSKHSL
ncbi:MAG: FAD-dependent monooxygenase [Actinocatenispora sp.]